jgi:hypothetical protein
MSLRGEPVEEQAVLGDGRRVVVRIAVPNDPYVRKRELDTVAVELWNGEQVLATVNSVLSPNQTSEARALAREIAANSPDAVRGAKRLFDVAWRADASTGLDLEAETQQRLIGSPNQLAAVQAALSGEPAEFSDPDSG